MLCSCQEADEEFVHDTTTISQITCRASVGGAEFIGTILEYNQNGTLVEGEFTEADVAGGYGRIYFEIPFTLQDDIDLTRVLLTANLTWDQFITPHLGGRHDITGEGIVITVKSGIGTTRSYRIQGEYN